MKTWKGIARFHDLGPGSWTLETESGQTLPLFGEVPTRLNGRVVVVRGTQAASFGFGPSGDGAGIEVKAIDAA